jgi:hypothetical protein
MCEKGAVASAHRLGSPAVTPASACIRLCGLAWGCSLGGREAGRAWCQGGGLLPGWAAFEKAGSFGSCGNSLLLAENYNRTTTNNTTEAQSAQRLNGGGRNSLRLDDPCWLWARPRPAAHRLCRILASGPKLVLLGLSPVAGTFGLLRRLSGEHSCQTDA